MNGKCNCYATMILDNISELLDSADIPKPSGYIDEQVKNLLTMYLKEKNSNE